MMKWAQVAAALLLGWCVVSRAAAAAAPDVMALGATHPELEASLKLIANNEPDLAAYLSDPDSVCTFFLPTEQAMKNSIKWLGKFAGKAAQNKTLGRSTLNYHVVPGQALTADQIGRSNTTRAMTRANETVFFWREKGKPFVYARPDLPTPLNKTNIKAGKCIVHSIDMALVPPTANSMVQGWLEEVGNMPKLRPKASQAPQQEPLPGSLEAGGSSPDAAQQQAPAPAPAKSSSSGLQSSALLAVALAAAAAAAL